MSESASKHSLRLGLWLPWAAFLVIVVGFFAYWQGARAEAIARLEREAAKARSAGYEAAYRLAGVDGFPFRLSLHLADAALAPPDRAWRAETKRLNVHVNIFNPNHVILSPAAPLSITPKAGPPMTLIATSAAMSVRQEAGALARASLELKEFAITRPQAPSLTTAKLLAHLRPAPDKPDHWQIVVMADGIAPAPVGLRPLAPEIAALRLAVDMDHAFASGQIVALELRAGAGVLKGAGALSRSEAGAITGRLDVAAEDAAAFAAAPGLLGADGKAALTLTPNGMVKNGERDMVSLSLPK